MRYVPGDQEAQLVALSTGSPDSLARELVDANVLLIPEQEKAPEDVLEAYGRRFSPVLRDFLARGGIIVALTYGKGGDNLLRGAGVLRVYDGEDITGEYVRVSAGYPSVAAGSDIFRAEDGATDLVVGERVGVVVTDSDGDPVVFYKGVGRGRVVVIGFDFYRYNERMASLLAHAVFGKIPLGYYPLVRTFKYDFTIKVPDRWILKGMSEGGLIFLVWEDPSGIASLTVSRMKFRGISLELLNSFKKEVVEKHGGSEVSHEITKVCGRLGYVALFSIPVDGEAHVWVTLLVVCGEYSYIAWYDIPVELLEEYTDLISASLASFRPPALLRLAGPTQSSPPSLTSPVCTRWSGI